ncbi:MAG: hypothetical protein ACRDH0_05360 [Actinomycetota bacterium]
MTAEELAAYEEKIRERARESAVRAITLGPLVAGVVVLAVLALTVGSVLASLGSGSGKGSAGACAASTACKLASIDAGTELDPDSGEVQEYQAALDALGVKCTNPSGRLGGMAVTSQELLGNGGVAEDLLTILRNVEASMPASAPRMECTDIFTSHVVLRGGHA